jgi:hypothetical protein
VRRRTACCFSFAVLPRYGGAFEAETLLERQSPGAQRAGRAHPGQDHGCGLVKQPATVRLPAARYGHRSPFRPTGTSGGEPNPATSRACLKLAGDFALARNASPGQYQTEIGVRGMSVKNAIALGAGGALVAGAVAIATASPSWAMPVLSNMAAVSTAASNQVTDLHYCRGGYYCHGYYGRGYDRRRYGYPWWGDPYAYAYPYSHPYVYSYPYPYPYPSYLFSFGYGWSWGGW